VIDTEEVQAAVEQTVEGSADVIVAQAAGAAASSGAAAGGAAAGMSTTALVVAGVAVAAAASSSSSSSSSSPAPAAPTVAPTQTSAPVALTSTAEAKTLTAGTNDTVDGSLLDSISGDTIIDGSTTDADVINFASSGAIDPVMVANIETVNATARYGSMTVNGSKFTGVKALNLDSTVASGTVTVSNASSDASASITSGKNITSLTVTTAAAGTGSAGVNVTAGDATTVVLTGTATKTDVINLSLTGGAKTITATTLGDTTDVLSITGTSSASTLTFSGAAAGPKKIDLKGAQNITIKGDADVFAGNTITDSGSATTILNVTAMSTASANLSKVGVDTIIFDAMTTGATLANGANIQVNSATLAGALVADTGATTLNVDLLKATTGALTNTGFTTFNVKADTVAVTSLNLQSGTSATVNLTGSKDVTVAATATAKVLDASGLAGKLTVTLDGTDDIATIKGGLANDKVTTGTGASAATIQLGGGDDTIVLGVTPGANKYVIEGGDGKDTIQASTGAIDFSAATALTSVFTGIEVFDVNGQTLTLTQKQLMTNGSSITLADTAGSGTFAVKSDGASSEIYDLSGLTFTAGQAQPTITVTTSTTVASTVTGSAGNETITTSSAADTINAGAGNDIVRGGGGADTINVGSGTDKVIVASDETATATALTGTIAASSGFGALTFSTTGMDIISGWGSTGDTIQLYTTGTTAIVTGTTRLTASSTLGADTDGDVALVTGTYSSGTFTATANGADTAVIWDSNGTTAAGTYKAIILVGYVDTGTADTLSAAGLITVA